MAYVERLIEWLRFRGGLVRFALTAKPVRGGSPDVDDPPKDAPKDDPKPAPKDGDPDPDPDDDDNKIKPDDDWETKARKHERSIRDMARRLKNGSKERDEALRKLKDFEDADKSDQQKAIDTAREEARAEALTESEKDRRADRLEVAVTRLAAKGLKIGDGDDAKTVKFADADDALLRVERGVRRGDIDPDDIYDSEGKVKTDALTEALAEIARDNPHLVGEGERSKPKGDSDARKGDPASGDLEAMTPEDHAKRKYPGNK